MTQTVPHAAVRQREVSVIRPVSGEVGTLQKRIPCIRHLRPLVASDITVLIMSSHFESLYDPLSFYWRNGRITLSLVYLH